MEKRGLLIIFEGLDRCGKSTQAKKLKTYFEVKKNSKAEIISFPDRSSESGKILDSYLKMSKNLSTRASHLLFSFNRWERVEDIKSSLNKGITVILDRYAYSGVAYSVAKGEPLSWCLMPDQGLPRPDIVVQLDTDIDKIKIRENFGEERHDNIEFLKKVKEAYKNFQNEKNWNVVDASKAIDDVHIDIVKIIERVLEQYEKTSDLSDNNFYPNKIGDDLFKV